MPLNLLWATLKKGKINDVILLIAFLALELEEKCNSQKEDLFAIKILAVTLFF